MNTHTGQFNRLCRVRQTCDYVKTYQFRIFIFIELTFIVGLRPYSCEGCKGTFEEYRSLHKHMGSCDKRKMISQVQSATGHFLFILECLECLLNRR